MNDIQKQIIDLFSKPVTDGKLFNKWSISDVLDVVMLYISLQPDLKKIGQIRQSDLCNIMQEAWQGWIDGHREFSCFDYLWIDYSTEISGLVEAYFFLYPGMSEDRNLFAYFSQSTWAAYRENHLKPRTILRWQEEGREDALPGVLDLAEEVVSLMRQKSER